MHDSQHERAVPEGEVESVARETLRNGSGSPRVRPDSGDRNRSGVDDWTLRGMARLALDRLRADQTNVPSDLYLEPTPSLRPSIGSRHPAPGRGACWCAPPRR